MYVKLRNRDQHKQALDRDTPILLYSINPQNWLILYWIKYKIPL